MNKNNKIVWTMIGLTAFSASLFTYDNFFLKEDVTREMVYVANQDIPADTTLTKDMFKKVSVSSDSILTGYVTNTNEFEGKKLKGGLLKEEALTTMRLTDEEDMEHNLEIKVEVDESSIDIVSNEYYNVYVILNVNGEVKIQKVFDMKQIETKAVSTTDGSKQTLVMKATEEEVIKYYDAKEKGKLIVAKNRVIDGGNEVITDYDPNSEDAKNAQKPTSDEESDTKTETPTVSVITKNYEEGDTLDSLAIKYKTDVETIKALNSNKEQFEVGEEIVLPAN
ncbi:SAF domain-containing protein [Clostridium disporicum]|uniref:SAF domain-containing protein n=1 Tax=Clostridium disporicum TaxID=84024 RepID=UPI0034A31CDD